MRLCLELVLLLQIFKKIRRVCPILQSTISLGFSINTFGDSGMRKMKMMILTTLFVAWSLDLGCEYTLCLHNCLFN